MSSRAILTLAAIAGAIALAGCNADDLARDARANKPIPAKLLAEISEKNMEKESPILVRIFKQESELEVWKQDRTGRYALLKTYPICRWSGELGPKIREGDRQAPEGFYTITPGQMNPNSSYYLSFNMGYPNAFDKALGRTGSQLMVHGDCSSRGCYAMTDEQISEIYSLGRESFFGGQRAFQVQAYPFHMTPVNMAKHRSNPHMPFWKMIKQGYDHFEVTRLEPKVDVCEKHYVFDAAAPADATKPLNFNPASKCPAYNVPEEIAQAVAEKTRSDERQVAELISRGTPVSPARTGIDGGMHPVFASKLGVQNARTGDGADYALAAYKPAPGTIPTHVNPPRGSADEPFTPPPKAADPALSPSIQTASTPAPAASAPRTNTASTRSEPNVFDRVANAIGFAPKEAPRDASSARVASPAPQPARTANAAAPSVIPSPRPATPVSLRTPEPAPRAPASATPKPAPATAMRGTTSDDDKKPAAASSQPSASASASSGSASSGSGNSIITSSSSTMAGSQPIRPAASFDSRWSAFR